MNTSLVLDSLLYSLIRIRILLCRIRIREISTWIHNTDYRPLALRDILIHIYTKHFFICLGIWGIQVLSFFLTNSSQLCKLFVQEGENEVIDLDDEEEIDDVEKDAASKSSAAEVIDLETPKKSGGPIEDKADGGSAKRSLDTADAEESEKKKSKPDQQEEEKAEEVKDD